MRRRPQMGIWVWRTPACGEVTRDRMLRPSMKPNPCRPHVILSATSVLAGIGVTALLAWKLQGLAAGDQFANAAILASFGAALVSIAIFLLTEAVADVKENVDILFKDILKQDQPWRRWSFLERNESRSLLNGDVLQHELKNPSLPFDVGTHVIEVDVPTVVMDFYDLPVLSNFLRMKRFKRAFFTRAVNRDHPGQEDKQSDAVDEMMKFRCLDAIWGKVVTYRISRYVHYFGCSLVVSSMIYAAHGILF